MKKIPPSNIIMYQTEDGKTKIDVRLENETLWLTQSLMAELFQTTKQNISLHIKNIFSEGELEVHSVVKEYLTTANDGKKYKTLYYNLEMIIAVGYRVRSHRGTQFRKWANELITEYLIKGFVMDDERLKEMHNPDNDYFEELLERIKDIRTSEKRFYKKICDIYALSIDYDPNTELTKDFFATVQNKLHYAIHGFTAAELIAERADSKKPNMGLTSWRKVKVRKGDVTVAKNYLSEKELVTLNRIVTMYLDFAEDQAEQHNPMYMKDWKEKLDAFLKFNGREVLDNPGKVSGELAQKLAIGEYEKFWVKSLESDDEIEDDFDKFTKKIDEIE